MDAPYIKAQTFMMVASKDEIQAFHRREANRYRMLATEADRQQAEQFRRMAAECDDLADDLESSASGGDTSGIALSKRRYPGVASVAERFPIDHARSAVFTASLLRLCFFGAGCGALP